MNKKITRELIKKNPNILFVFGDNDARTGFGGMAKEARGESNAIGLRTKKYPSTEESSYYTDEEFEDNKKKIDEDIELIRKQFVNYICIFIPNGIGLGLAQLNIKAPQTYQYLQGALSKLKEQVEK